MDLRRLEKLVKEQENYSRVLLGSFSINEQKMSNIIDDNERTL